MARRVALNAPSSAPESWSSPAFHGSPHRAHGGRPSARVLIDALPGHSPGAHIESFAPGSGSQFALLLFEPGTGDFSKIVQRIPVRIRFDPGQSELSRMRASLSSTVTVSLDEEHNPQVSR